MMDDTIDAVSLAVALTTAWLGNPNTRAKTEDVTAFLDSIHSTLTGILAPVLPAPDEPKPTAAPGFVGAVSVRKSLASPDHIISMIDGKPYKVLTRHLKNNGLTPSDYRERYGLKPDYPMTAHTYSEWRREMAMKIGLGRKLGEKAPPRKTAKPKVEPRRKAD